MGGAGMFTYRHPIILNMIPGAARVIHYQLDAQVLLDGSLSGKSKIFYTRTRFHGTPTSQLIIWIQKAPFERIILTLDLDANTIGLPNAGSEDYDIIFNKLIQSESGDNSIPITDAKSWPNHEPNLKFEKHTFRFTLPECEWFPAENITIKTPLNDWTEITGYTNTLQELTFTK